MRIGSLNKLITLQRPVRARNATTGAMSTTWEDVIAVWADIRYTSGLEMARANTILAPARASIRIRKREVDPTWRVKRGEIIFAILGVLPDERGNEYTDLVVETGASNE